MLLIALALPLSGFSQWVKVDGISDQQKVNESVADIQSGIFYDLNLTDFRNLLKNVAERQSGKQGVIISIPNVKGNLEQFRIWELSNMVPDLQAKFPDIRSYVGSSIEDPSAYLRFSISPQGLSSLVLRSGKSEYIEPMTADGKTYIVFDEKMKKASSTKEKSFECTTNKEVGMHR